jgi:hypothetical protein
LDDRPQTSVRPDRAARCWATFAGAAAVLALVLILITAGASHPYYPTWVTFAVFALIFPVHLRTVIVGIRRQRAAVDKQAAIASLLRPWPLPINRSLALVVVVAYAAAAALTASSVPAIAGGQPERHAGRFYLNDHGTLTQVSETTYYSAEIGGDRWFLGGAAIFLGVGAVINLRLANGFE